LCSLCGAGGGGGGAGIVCKGGKPAAGLTVAALPNDTFSAIIKTMPVIFMIFIYDCYSN
jgi:hypothetical protein